MMEKFVAGFIRASLVWLGVGVAIGVAMAFWPYQAAVYRPAHMHANLLGFVSMMIFGVAYHVIPRFTGSALHDRRLAWIHLFVANGGLVVLVAGWMMRVRLAELSAHSMRLGAALSAIGALLFIYNMWRTLGARPAPTPAAAAPSLTPLTRGQRVPEAAR
jgi:cbb3-type cytochrome oxidase subunit 1